MAAAELDFTDYIAERTRDFTGREWVVAAIDTWLADPNAPRFFVITGEPGIGKTAIAARLTQLRPVDAYHFCIPRRADTVDPLDFVRSLSRQLTRIEPFARSLLAEKGTHVSVNIKVEENRGTIIGVRIDHLIIAAPSPAVAFQRALVDPLKQMVAGGFDRTVLLLVDALDEAAHTPGQETIADLLAGSEGLPSQVRMVLTTRSDSEVLRHFEQKQIPYFGLDAARPENMADVRAYVQNRIDASPPMQQRLASAHLPQPAFLEQVTSASQGNFLYLVWLLPAIADGRQPLDRLADLPQGLDGIYREFLRTRAVGKETVTWRSYRPLLGTLAAAQEALDGAQLARFSGVGGQILADFLLDAGQFLDPTQLAAGRYAFYHRSVSDFLGDKTRAGEFWIDLQAMHRQLASLYVQPTGGAVPIWSTFDLYAYRYLPRHLVLGGQSEVLRRLLLGAEWPQAKLQALDINALLGDYDLIRDDVALRLVQGALRMASFVLADDKSQLAGQLWGRLQAFDDPAIVTLLADVVARQTAPWLRTLHPSLLAPGGGLLRTLAGHTSSVQALALLPDGRRVISASDDSTLRVWDVDTGDPLRTFSGYASRLNTVVLTPDGRQAITSGWDNTVRLWDVQTGEMLRSLGEPAMIVSNLVAMPDGRHVLLAPHEQSPCLWDLQSGELTTILPSLKFAGCCPVLLRDGQQAFFASYRGDLEIWDLQTGEKLRTLGPQSAGSDALCITPDGRRAVTGSGDSWGKSPNVLHVWDIESGKLLHVMEGHTKVITALALTPDGKRAVSASFDHTLKVWDLDSGSLLQTLSGHNSEVDCVVVTPDGKRALSGGSDNVIHVWDLQAVGAPGPAPSHENVVCTLSVTPDGTQAISGSWDRTARIWDIASGQIVRVLADHIGAVTGTALTADGKLLVTSCGDQMLRVWDLESGQMLNRIQCRDQEDGSLDAVAVTPGGKHAVVLNEQWELSLWDLRTGKFERELSKRGYSDTALAMTLDGKVVLSPTVGGDLHVWSVKKKKKRTMLRPTDEKKPDIGESIAVSPQGTLAVVGHRGGSARVWDLKAGKMMLTFDGHRDDVKGAAIFPNGKHVVSVSDDWTLCVWNMLTGEALARFSGDGRLLAVAVAPDGRTIAVGEASGRVHFLRLETSSPEQS